MDQSIGFDLTFTNAHLKAALFVSLLSVSLVVCLLSYINHILKRSYFGLWIIAWGFYGIWLGINFAVDQKEETPLVFVFKQFSLGAVAVFLLWGGGRFLRLKVRQEMIGLYFLFLFVWSCVGAFYLDDNPFEFQMPVFVITGLTSMIVGWGYAHPKFRRGVLGEGLMSTGFFLWGFYLLAFPFFLSHDMLASSFIISTVLHLFIAISMVVLVLDESRRWKARAEEQVHLQKTETTLFENRAKATEKRYRALFELAAEGILICSPHGEILELNEKARRILAGGEGKVKGVDFFSFLQMEEGAFESDGRDEDRMSGLLEAVQVRLKNWEGRSVMVDLEGAKLLWEDEKEAYQVFIRDRSNKAQLEQQLRQAEKLSALGQMISGIAHELNNPLAAIKGYLELFVNDPRLPDRTRQDLRKVMRESQRAAKLVTNFLSFARERPASREIADLNQIVNRVVEMRQFECRIAGVDVDCMLAGKLHPAELDVDQVQQVLVNLINNSIQAMIETPAPHRIVIRTWNDGDRVRLSVQDTGPGIPEAQLSKIFEPFFTTKDVGSGTGLGLSIAHSIMRDHGGIIAYHDGEEGGACFELDFTAKEGAELTYVSEDEPSEGELSETGVLTPSSDEGNGRILVVDDEESIAELLKELLMILGHDVTMCHSARHALKQLEQESFEVILSDFRMPGMDGRAFYEEAMKIDPAFADRFIFLTGDLVNGETQEFIRSINAPCVDKPFQLEDVRRAVNEVLESVAGRDKS